MPGSFSFHRRRLLQIGAIGYCGANLPAALAAEASPRPDARADACILLYMDGGPSHIDLLDLKPHAPAEIRGPYRPIDTTVPGIAISELLPRLAAQMHRATLIRSVRHEETVHDPAVYQMLTGYKHTSSAGGLKVEETDLPQIGSAFGYADARPAVMPKVLQLPETMTMEARVLPGQNAGILGATFDPFHVDVSPAGKVAAPPFDARHDVPAARSAQRADLLRRFNHEFCRLPATRLLAQFDSFQDQALEILAAPRMTAAFDLDREPPTMHALYGRHRHGQSVLLARRLVEAGARFVTVYWGREPQDWNDGRGARPANNPWDTHRNHFPLVEKSLAPRADQALAALLLDLSQRGLLDRTLVVWMGDFGRTPRITKPWASRDHWPHAFSLLMAGAGVIGGNLYGGTDPHAALVVDNPVSPADLTATILESLGIDPHATVRGARGQPHTLSRGAPLNAIFS